MIPLLAGVLLVATSPLGALCSGADGGLHPGRGCREVARAPPAPQGNPLWIPEQARHGGPRVLRRPPLPHFHCRSSASPALGRDEAPVSPGPPPPRRPPPSLTPFGSRTPGGGY